jgi:hypothetical protein
LQLRAPFAPRANISPRSATWHSARPPLSRRSSFPNPVSQPSGRGARKGHSSLAYAANYLIDTYRGVMVNVEARQEVGSVSAHLATRRSSVTAEGPRLYRALQTGLRRPRIQVVRLPQCNTPPASCPDRLGCENRRIMTPGGCQGRNQCDRVHRIPNIRDVLWDRAGGSGSLLSKQTADEAAHYAADDELRRAHT